MSTPIFEPTLHSSYQKAINELLQCISESILPNSIKLYAYRFGTGCFHVLKLDDQLEITIMEGKVDIPDRKNCLDYIRVGHIEVVVLDSVDITYFTATIINHFKSINENLTFSLVHP
ncbi:hypothetical protein [Photobacterium damselae]|uniref:hypothetical protein n=1 Tax=Photobacterium damselae TaxID=38293 RepID=UPI001ADE45F8|nr:hypothetical protein [Photobacterium damselae]